MATTTTKKGLGKGLSALISENYVQPGAAGKTPAAKAAAASRSEPSAGKESKNGLQNIPHASLHAGKYQPRTQFSDSALSELAESIRKNGIMQPVIVRISTKQPGKYEIVAGERRWRAARQAGLDQIPVLIREITDQHALEMALVENIQRQDLSPLEEAGGYQRLIEEFAYTQEDLAGAIGKSRSHVANLLRLLALPDDVKEMLGKGELTMGHARALLNAPNAGELAHDIVRKGLNVRQAEQISRDAQGVEKKSAPRTTSPRTVTYAPPATHKDADIVALEETLSENLGLKVSINDRGQSGEIVIAYDSLSQLDEILRRLGDGI